MINRFDTRPESAFSPVCARCRNIKSLMQRTCAAFPAGIPDSIWNGDNDHTQPYPGDNGIQFTARKQK